MIAYFVYNLNKYSGASQQAFLLAGFLKIPIIFFNHEDGDFSIKKVSETILVINLPRNRLFRMFVIVWFLLREKIKILHLHGFFKHGLILGFLLRKKVILKTTLMGSDDFFTLSTTLRFKLIFRFLLSCVDLNVCLTEQLKKINLDFMNEAKIKLIPNSVVIPKDIPVEKQNIFCFIGLVCERKGAYESIEYYLRHYLSTPGSLMYVIGPIDGIKESDNNYIQKCLALVSSYGAQSRVNFLGNRTKSEVMEYLKKSKALIFFSRKEGMPNVVLEAMACNCAPITTGIDGVIDELLDEDTKLKLTVQSSSEKITLDVIDSVLEEKELVYQAEAKFSVEYIAEMYLKQYKAYVD